MNARPGLPYTVQPEDGGCMPFLDVRIRLESYTMSQYEKL
jgi:hypothetical protein